MKDDNCLRLIYEVAAYRERTKESTADLEAGPAAESDRFGTILAVEDDPAREELNARYFDWQLMRGDGLAESARQLEIFLDAVAMYASGDNSWLLDRNFSYLVVEPEQVLAAQVSTLAREIRRVRASGGAWEALADELDRFGAKSNR